MIQILACLTTNDWCLAFVVMANITNMFLQSLITDIALTLIFCLYPLQATIQISGALACHTAKGVTNFQIDQLAVCRLLIKYCCTVGNIAKNTNLLHSWPLEKLNISTRLLWLWPFFPMGNCNTVAALWTLLLVILSVASDTPGIINSPNNYRAGNSWLGLKNLQFHKQSLE